MSGGQKWKKFFTKNKKIGDLKMSYHISDVNKKKERILKTLKCQEPDRIPLHDFFWKEFLTRWKKEKNLPDETNIYYYYDMDMMVISPNMDPKKKSFELIEKGDNYIIWKSGFGCILKKVDYSPMPIYLDFSLKSKDDYKNYEFDDPNDKSRYHDARQDIISGDGFTEMLSFAEDINSSKDKICIFGSICEGHETLWRMRGPEGVYIDLATHPTEVRDFVERIGDFMIEIGKKQLDFKDVNGLFIWGDVAYKNGMLFSPKIWKMVFYPVLKRICTELHNYRKEALLIYHGCGNTISIFDDLIEAGIDSYHTLEVKAGMDVVELKKKYGNKLSYIGNIDALNVLPGIKSKIKEDLEYRLNAAKGGGYIPSSDHSVPGNVSAENYDYFIEIIRKYGNYPIELDYY